MKINQITERVIACAIEVHRTLGPGLLESDYQQSLAREFQLRHLSFERETGLATEYKGLLIDCAYRMDFVVENLVVVELKATEVLLPVHDAQLLTYLRLGGWKVGLLINFNVKLLKSGIRRLVLGLEE